jgi:hypothetical protein
MHDLGWYWRPLDDRGRYAAFNGYYWRGDCRRTEWADGLLTSRIRGIGSRRSSPTPLPMLFSHFFHQFGRWFPKSRKVLDSRVRSDAAEVPMTPVWSRAYVIIDAAPARVDLVYFAFVNYTPLG